MENQEDIVITPVPKKDTSTDGRKYTQITHATCDCKVVRILKNLLSGRYGSLTGLHSYLFQNILSNNTNQNLKNALNALSLEELLHAQLLGNAIQSFGGVPRFSNGQGSFWNARNVNYITDVPQFIRANIAREQRIIQEYQSAVSKITNESLKLLLNEIIQDKQRHITILNSYL